MKSSGKRRDLAHGILQDVGARRHLEEIRNINVDNQGAIALARNAEFHARTKHIDIQYHFLREHVQIQTITLSYCPMSDMTADIFTKALPHPSFIKHSIDLGLIDHSAFLLQDTIGDNHTTGYQDNATPEDRWEESATLEDTWEDSTGEGWSCESPALLQG